MKYGRNIPLQLLVITLVIVSAVNALNTPVARAEVKNVEVSARSLNDALQRIDNTLANCTGVLRNGEERGLTRTEHEQLKADAQMIAAALNSFIDSQNKLPAETYDQQLKPTEKLDAKQK